MATENTNKTKNDLQTNQPNNKVVVKVDTPKNENSNSANKGVKKPYSRPRRNYYKKNRSNLKRFSFKKVSILIPLYNEEESLRPLYSEIKDALKKISIDYEILFFDDGSKDTSLEIIKDLAKKDPKIKYISFRKNYGKSAALQLGFKAVTGDAVITMDADLQDDPAEIPNLLAKLDEGYDLVSGWKKKRNDPTNKTSPSKFFNFVNFSFINLRLPRVSVLFGCIS
mgnify:CR=1 FL=1